MNCGLCKIIISDDTRPGVVANYAGGDQRSLCNDCLDFVVAFALSISFAEAEGIIKAEPLKFQMLKEKLEVV